MKSTIILLVFILITDLLWANDPNNVVNGTVVKINTTKLDSANVRSIASLLQNIPAGTAATTIEITIDNNRSDSLVEKSDITGLKIKNVYHKSFFKERDKSIAVGFENFVLLDNNGFDALNDQFIQSGRLVLFVNGKVLPRIKLSVYDADKKILSFDWVRSDSLTKYLSQSYITKLVFRVSNATVGIGYFDETTNKWVQISSLGSCKIDMIKVFAILLVVCWFLSLVVFFICFGSKTNLLRKGIKPNSQFSLSLAQFAFWTIIIFTSYFYLWIATFELVTIPQSTLVLLGITAFTTAGSRLVDIRKSKESAIPSSGFFTDLLSEDDLGLSVHRCQLFLVTIMFGTIYFVNVFKLQALPDFNDSLLWVIGISSGTFVGIKTVERTPQTGNQNPQGTGAGTTSQSSMGSKSDNPLT
jgi:hypothetical protein